MSMNEATEKEAQKAGKNDGDPDEMPEAPLSEPEEEGRHAYP
jgi:hypothetical protein